MRFLISAALLAGLTAVPVIAGKGPMLIVPRQLSALPATGAASPAPAPAPAIARKPPAPAPALPRPKPDGLARTAAKAAPADVALPRPKPAAPLLASMAPVSAPASKPVSHALDHAALGNTDAAPSTWPQEKVAEARAECARLLAGINAVYVPEAPFGGPGSCGTPAPVRLSSVAGVRVNPPATLNCQMVAALHGWITDKVQPAAQRTMNTRMVEIKNASSYACRRRNNASSGKMSEHATANALDIESFTFANEQLVSVEDDWNMLLQSLHLGARGDFLRSLDKSACQYFNTVMSPKANRFHEDHFHVDLLPLRPGRWKYCR